MTGEPVDLDTRRGIIGLQATEDRRQQLQRFQADQVALRQQQHDLEELLLATPAETWPEAAAKAQYLIQLYANTKEAQEPRRTKLIAQALEDLNRLCDRAAEDT